MNKETHILALRMVARLALGGGILGAGLSALACGGATVSGGDPAVDGEPSEHANSDDALRRKVKRHDGGCDSNTPAPTSDAACILAIKSAHAGPYTYRLSSKRGILPDGSVVPSDVMSCCDRLVETDAGRLSTNERVKWECCDFGVGTSISCTPWGPPMPPSMRVRRDFLRVPA
jgi:hypothetical protein